MLHSVLELKGTVPLIRDANATEYDVQELESKKIADIAP
jgi:hypothetical protein